VILAGGDQIEPGDLPEKLSQPGQIGQLNGFQVGARASLEELEQEHIRRVLSATRSREEAAQILRIDPATLYRKRKKYLL